MKNNSEVEKRLKNVKKIYSKTIETVEAFSGFLPDKYKKEIRDKFVNNKELKELMDGIDSHRPPRLFLIGRTGVGKSSLINALLGGYIAKIDNIRSCTNKPLSYELKDDDNRTLMHVLDSRGINESEQIDDTTAETDIINQVNEFNPDAIIFVLGAARRDGIDDDVIFINKICADYKKVNNVDLPVVVVVNRCDDLAPAREKDPQKYPPSKIQNINETVQYYKKIVSNNKLQFVDIIPVSSYIDWKDKEGNEIDVKDINKMPENEWKNLEIAFDGRYNIEKLFDILLDAIRDCEARMGLRMAFRLEEFVERMAYTLTHIVASINGAIAAVPIPVPDIPILMGLEALLVAIIASLSGREFDKKTALEFIGSLGGVGIVGNLCKAGARNLIKFFPGVGTAISAGIAIAGTEGIGFAAIQYFIKGLSMEEVKKMYKEYKAKK